MKARILFFFYLLLIISIKVTAQTSKKLEADLLKSFRTINYWTVQTSGDTTGTIIDSLDLANDEFRSILGKYASKYPFTIKFPFDSLTNAGLGILTSADGQLRIYSWDMGTGGTQGAMTNLFQYKIGDQTDTLSDVPTGSLGSPADFKEIYRFTANGKTCYAIIYAAAEGFNDHWEGLMIFGIRNKKLDYGINLIKTTSGLNSHLDCYYRSGVDGVSGTEINFNSKTKTIKFPLIDEDNHMTSKSIVYKFNGRYFIRIKN